MIPARYIGLDLETTGSNHRKHKIIQVGIAIYANRQMSFSARDVHQSGYAFEDEALKINQFTHARIEQGFPMPTVEAELLDFIDTRIGPEPKRLKVVGWNVAGFDLQFVQNECPSLMERLHYRTVDLNAVNDTVALITKRDPDKVKRDAKAYAVERFKEAFSYLVEFTEHDAGHDAVTALYAWEWYLEFLQSDRFLYTVMRNRLVVEEGVL